METTVPIAIVTAAAFLLALGAVAEDRRSRIRRREAEEPAFEPPLVHSINDDRCIGCEACVDACPTEVLELVDHKARVIRFSDCVQCEQCANACPTTAMVMYRAGAAPQTLTVPELDDHFQTGVPGQYLIGEVAGKPLVKNAANLGRAVVEHITRDLASRGKATGDLLDVVIVGSGPGGLSAGLTCLRNALSCVVLEKEHVLASTVSRYPKGKLFMAEPVDSGNVSYLPVFDASKEQLVAAWQKVVNATNLPVKLGEAVDTVVRDDSGVFTVKTTVATYRARAVVLATGLRGKPRLLAVPGANLEKVKSRLDDPDEFAGQHALVVGGGDSAVEAAMSLADVGATVTLSYRGDGFKRCKQGNQKRLAELTAEGVIAVLLESNVQEFTPDQVTIKLKDGTISTLPNQHAFVLIGADTPVAWLTANNVRFVEREHLYALGSTEDTVRKLVPDAVECPKEPDAAIAILLGKTPKTSHRRLRSMVEHIGEAVREMTGVFRISDLEHTKSGTRTGIKKLATPLSGTKAVGRRTTGNPALVRRTTSHLIPPDALTRPRAATPAPRMLPVARPANNPFEPDPTVQVDIYGRPRKPKQVTRDTTEEMLSLPARLAARQLGTAIARGLANPFDTDPTTMQHDRYRDNDRGTGEATAITSRPPVPDTNVEVPIVPRRSPPATPDTDVDVPVVRRTAPPNKTTYHLARPPRSAVMTSVVMTPAVPAPLPRSPRAAPPPIPSRRAATVRDDLPARLPRGTGAPPNKGRP